MLITFFICWRYYLHNREWREHYRKMTNDLVERMVGHRTRLAQEDHENWHVEEDQSLDRYLSLSGQMDRIGICLSALISRGWMIVGLGGMAYLFVSSPESPVQLAISLGGIMLASQALNSLPVNASTTSIGARHPKCRLPHPLCIRYVMTILCPTFHTSPPISL